MKVVKTNSLYAWFLAIRPKTLTGAAAPVLIGGALAWHFETLCLNTQYSFLNVRFFLCLGFALMMQIAANLINDYYDYRKGTDRNEDRLGPERACAQGWITPSAMKWGIAVSVILSCSIGMPLAFIGGWWLTIVGLWCVLFAFLYTTSFSYLGLGDILVLVFFGLVPVCFTYYVLCAGDDAVISAGVRSTVMLGIAQGLVTDLLLMVNNYRDRNQDAVSGKKTIVVRMGAEFGIRSYLVLGLLGAILAVMSTRSPYSCIVIALWVLLHLSAYRKMTHLDGRDLNRVLGLTARNIFLFAVAVSALLIVNS